MSEREPFWTIDADEVIRRLETDPDDGLRSAVATARLERCDGNVLATLQRTPWYTDMAQSGLRTLAIARRPRARRRSDWAWEVREDVDGRLVELAGPLPGRCFEVEIDPRAVDDVALEKIPVIVQPA